MQPFQPLFFSPHLQTIAGHYWPRPSDPLRFPVESKLYPTAPGVQILIETQKPQGPPRGEMILVHGLEGSGKAGYMRSLSQAGAEAGFLMHRFHLRTCGGTEHLCQTLYHAGLTSDLLVILREFEQQRRTPVYLVGFSLGGNIVLKLVGELGEEAPRLVAGVCAASTPIDLAACTRRMHQLDNRIYELRFVRKMRIRMCNTKRYTRADFKGLSSLLDVDNRITAPAFGFRDAMHYYTTQSCSQILESIRVPTLLIQARDDTFIPFESFQHPAFERNPCLRLLVTEHGGHLGFVSRRRPRFWLDHAILEWVLEQNGTKTVSVLPSN